MHSFPGILPLRMRPGVNEFARLLIVPPIPVTDQLLPYAGVVTRDRRPQLS